MKKIISAALAALMLASTVTASAEPFITVSAWAYNDVSNFRKTVEMPAIFDGINDYTQPINRIQFAELLYSSLVSAGTIKRSSYDYGFEDIKSVAASELKSWRILTGEVVSEDGYGNKAYNLYPDRLLTREEMATLIYRTADYFCKSVLTPNGEKPSDINEISDYAKDAVVSVIGSGLLNGTGEGKFSPKDNLTVEQAVTALYRLFQVLPTSPGADGASIISDDEFTVQTYSNGLTETRHGNVLYLKDGNETLMGFETDIYENIFSADNGGVTYAAAENCYDRTDVYNARTQELLFKIPYPIYETAGDYIITKSSDYGPMTFGLYSYDGKEVLEPKYSLGEIDELKANNFKISDEEYRAPDGWFYYADWDDEGHMYKIDTNGENKQKLSDNDCFYIVYVNGWLYYSIRGEDENKLYVMRKDGKYEQRLTDNTATLMYASECTYQTGGIYSGAVMQGVTIGYNPPYFDKDGWVYYFDHNSGNVSSTIWRVKMSEDGKAIKEEISDVPVYSTKDPVSSRDVQQKNGMLYFLSNIPGSGKYGGPVYRYDGNETIQVAEFATSFGFHDDELVTVRDEKDNYIAYISDLDGENGRVWQEWMDWLDKRDNLFDDDTLSTYEDPETGALISQVINDDASDEKFTILYRSTMKQIDETTQVGDLNGLYVRAADGTETLVCGDGWSGGYHRVGDILYYPKDEIDSGRASKALWAYDMNTGEQTRIVGQINTTDINGDGWLLYTDNNSNYWKYDFNTGESTEVFPNAGLKRYGEFYKLHWQGFYKIDTDGNFTKLADSGAYRIYVPNGAQTNLRGY